MNIKKISLIILAFIFATNALAREVTSIRELQPILSSRQPTVLFFYAPWCGACKAMKEPFEAVSQLFKNDAQFIKISADNDAMKSVIDAFGIDAIPTLIFKHVGNMSQEQLSSLLQSFLPKNAQQQKKIDPAAKQNPKKSKPANNNKKAAQSPEKSKKSKSATEQKPAKGKQASKARS